MLRRVDALFVVAMRVGVGVLSVLFCGVVVVVVVVLRVVALRVVVVSC